MRKFLALILITLLAAKIAAVLARGPVPLEMDNLQYWNLSQRVADGDVLMVGERVAYRTPAYPWLIALVRATSPYPLATIVVIQGIMWLASFIIAGLMAARITKIPSAFGWTIATAIPGVSAAVYCGDVLTEPLFTFLLMLNLWAMMDYAKHETWSRVFLVAITFAVTLLTRPIIMLLWIAHIVFVLLIHLRRRKRLGKEHTLRIRSRTKVVHGLVAAITILILVSPWLIRNTYLFGKPFLTEFVGRNIWIVTFQDGSGAGLELPSTDHGAEIRWRLGNVGLVDNEEETWRDTWTASKALVRSGLNDAQTDHLMKQVAVDAMLANDETQKTFAWKAFRRCVNFWRCAVTDLPEQGADGDFRGQATWKYSIPMLEWLIENRISRSVIANTILTALIAAATLYLVINRTTRPYGFWIALMLAYFCAVTGILEIPNHRYRIIVRPLVVLVIGAAAAILVERFVAKKKSSGATA